MNFRTIWGGREVLGSAQDWQGMALGVRELVLVIVGPWWSSFYFSSSFLPLLLASAAQTNTNII